ncbi:hypothetical protein SUGI_0338650 [Cryptomeria japonica]|nr:hypothetical protein SUGI_0338650 [Cryptomeria japonica]
MGSGYAVSPASLTDGFTLHNLTEENIKIQKPYDKNVSERYSYVNGVHSMWVYNKDKPFKPDSTTNPRTEIRVQGYDYKSGIWQFEGDGYVPHGSNGMCVMQIHGFVVHATVLMLFVINGDIKYYHSKVMVSDIYDRWIHFNVIHDTDQRIVTVFADGQETLAVNVTGGDSYYFKCGVYAQTNSSSCVESRWKNIKVWSKQ